MASKTGNEGMPTLTPSEAMPIIKRHFEKKRPLFLHGQPGIGKSDIMAQIGAETGRPVIDFRLILCESVDLRGLPIVTADGSVKWQVSDELPQAGKMYNGLPQDRAILFLDELNSAPQNVQGAAYQLILNRRIGEYFLPDDVVVVAAGNRMTDRGVTYKMPSPLANRFSHYELVPSFDDWISWAVKAGIRSDILGFLQNAQQFWNTFENAKDNMVFATPRSWAFVSSLIDDNASDKQNSICVSGSVGEAAAIAFMQHRELASKIPDTRTILNGDDVSLRGIPMSVRYTLVYNIAFMLHEIAQKKSQQSAEYVKAYDNYLAFVTKQMEPELAVLSVRLMTKEFKLAPSPTKMKNWGKFFEKFKEYMPTHG